MMWQRGPKFGADLEAALDHHSGGKSEDIIGPSGADSEFSLSYTKDPSPSDVRRDTYTFWVGE